jgi:hypothetical protein
MIARLLDRRRAETVHLDFDENLIPNLGSL